MQAGMGQRALQAFGVGEGLTGYLGDGKGQRLSGQSTRIHARRCTTCPQSPLWLPAVMRYLTKSKMREARMSAGHFQISRGLAPPAMEKKMMLARPTRFSAGT